MADPHAPVSAPPGPNAPEPAHDDPDHHAVMFKIYMVVAVVLAVCTGSSFLFNELVRHDKLSVIMGFVLILGVAVLKACLVGYYFMHLKWDWRLLYFIIVPVFILGVMMVIILMPDCVIGPSRDANDAIQIASEMQ